MKLLVIDSNSIMNRAYYGIKTLTSSNGTPTNAIFGFMKIILKLIGEEKLDSVVFTFDRREPTFRHQRFDGYKATRSGMPDDLAVQFPMIKELITAWGYPIVERAGFEADDLIGSLCRRNSMQGELSVIVTGDRDSFQLVDDHTSVRLATTKVARGEDLRITPAYIQEQYGVTPKQLIEVKGLMGDASDNIPGVAGVGEKTALSLIGAFGSIDGVYAHIEDPSIKKGVRQKLIDGKEQAYMSRELAEICCEVPLPSVEELAQLPTKTEVVRGLLRQWEVKSLLTHFEAKEIPSGELERVKVEPTHALMVSGEEEQIFTVSELYLESRFEGRILTYLAIGGMIDQKMVFCEQEEPRMVEELFRKICNFKGTIYTDHLKELHFYGFLLGIPFVAKAFDLQIAAYVLSPLSTEYGLKTLAEQYGLPPTFPMLGVMPEIVERQQKEIQESEQEDLLWEIELPLAEVLASMESVGFYLDQQGLTAYGEEISQELSSIAEEIYQFSGEIFNINSPKQLGVILFEKLGLPTRKKTKSGFSTNAEVLDSLKNKHPIIPLILKYRQLSKLHSTYVLGLLGVVGEDGRIHTVFRQKETRTGRISSTEPNLQNIPVRTPLGRELRRFFVAKEGCTLVDADYSQIELRVLASIAKDEKMMAAFKEGVDIHTQTASEVFDLPPNLVSPILRSRAKAVNFGIVYGIGAFSLSQDIGVSVAEADRYIKDYLGTYPGVANYMEEIKAFGSKEGYVATLYGRRRPIPELLASNKMTKALGERVAMNTPIQGTAADIIKRAMIRVYDRLTAEGLEARLLLQVHDELIVEAPLAEREQVERLLAEEMQAAADLLVPLTAEAHSGLDWLSAK